jgi:pimeloyl-ACP methyl ester carboxylesterase
MKNNRGNSAAVFAMLLMGMTGCSRPPWTPIGPAVDPRITSDGVLSLAPARAPRLVVADVRVAAPIGPDQDTFEGWIDVDGRALYLACLGVGEPVVVFEMDQGESGAMALAYAGAVSARTRVCYYDRPNVYGGYSDPVSGARTSQDMVNDLAGALRGAGLVSPYILAGKSFGAMNAALFAAQRSKDVVGLVLLDPLWPGPVETEAEAIEIEFVDMDVSAIQLKAAPRLLSVPTVMLTTERLPGDPSFYSRLAPRLQRVAVSDNGLVAAPSARDRVSRAIIQMIEEYRK